MRDSDHLPFRYYTPPPKTCAPKPRRSINWLAMIAIGTLLVTIGALAGIRLFG